MQFTVYRITTFLFMFVVFANFSRNLVFDFYVAFLFSHYILAVAYSGRQINSLKTDSRYYAPLIILTILTIGITYFGMLFRNPAIQIYFGIHFALSETYMALKGIPVPKLQSLTKIIASRILFNFFAYLVILRHTIPFVGNHIEIFLSLALFFFVISVIFIVRSDEITVENKRDLLIFEIVGLTIMMVLFFSSAVVPFWVATFYHIGMWLMFPAYNLPRDKSNRYLFYNVLLITLFFIFTPSAGSLQSVIEPMGKSTWVYFSILFAYVHITSSFALSAMNPKFIRRWFYAD